MPRYTYRDRQKSAATRRRKAKLRKDQILAGKSPTVNLAKGIDVTPDVEKRLTKKANSGIGCILIFIWFLTGFIVYKLPDDLYIGQIICISIALLLTIIIVLGGRSRTITLAKERKKRLDETRQFYSSTEWQQVRKQVIQRDGNVCYECGKIIQYDITVDHILPRSKYPDLALDVNNLRVLCRRCNSKKGTNDWNEK